MKVRLVVAGAVMVILLPAAFVASSRTADAACTADPPGVVIPEHDSRSQELRLTGWHCVLERGGTTTLDISLGWWPDDPSRLWARATDP